MAITVQLTRWLQLNFTDRRDITWFQIVVTNDLYIFIDLPVHSLTKLTSWNSNWNPKIVLHTQKMVTCTVMASWNRVLHLCVTLKINSKQRTKLKTANSGGIFVQTTNKSNSNRHSINYCFLTWNAANILLMVNLPLKSHDHVNGYNSDQLLFRAKISLLQFRQGDEEF